MALVLVPGFMLDAELWRDVEPALPEFGPLVHADLSRDGSIEAMAERALADAPPRFGLIGFSMGGYVAREIARQAPGRVNALVLIATSARADDPAQTRRKAKSIAARGSAAFTGVSRASVQRSLHPDRTEDGAMVERIRAMSRRLGRDAFLRQAAMPRDSDLERLDDIRVPTLVIAAAQDRLRGVDEAREMQAGIPGARLHIIEGSGHMLPLEASAALASVLVPWLRRHV